MNQEDVERVVAENPDFPPPGREPYHRDLSHLTLTMLGHAHIDLGYRWDLSETIHRIVPWTFRGVLDVMNRTPGFTFAQSQLFLYEAVERHYPELFTKIRSAVAAGRWEVVGGAWCEYDTALTGGEAVIRQHLYGLQYAMDRLGVSDNQTAFVPDSFIRHPRTLPQILSGCGIEFYVFGRGLPQEANQDTRRAFVWTGPDGSAITAYLPFGPYSNPPLTVEHLARLSLYAEASVGSVELSLYGTGDHGGGPREPDLQALAALGEQDTAPRWRFGLLADFVRAFAESLSEPLKRYDRSLVAFATGALTSQAQTKRWNSRLERMLVETEALLTMSTILQRKPAYPRVDLLEAWRTVLTHQFHDILPGTSVAAVYRRALADYRRVYADLFALQCDAVSRIASRVGTGEHDHALVVVNPTGARWQGVVLTTIPAIAGARISTAAGEPVRWARYDTDGAVQGSWESIERPSVVQLPATLDTQHVLLSVDLEAYGYETLWLDGNPDDQESTSDTAPVTEASEDDLDARSTAAGFVATVGRFRIAFDEGTGDLSELTDRTTGNRVLKAGSNALELWDEHEQATSWVEVLDRFRDDIRLVHGPQVIEQNRLRTIVQIESRSTYSRFFRRIVLYPSLDRVDFAVKIEWNEPNAILKIPFKAAVTPQTVMAGLPYGFEDVTSEAGTFLVHRWVRLGPEGFAILNDGAYGADRVDDTVRMSVVRTARDMDPEMSHGEHVLRYSLVVDAASVGALEDAYRAFAAAPLCAWTGRHPGGLKTWGRIDSSQALPPRGSFASCPTEGVALEVLKMPNEFYSPEGFVVRVRELEGTPKDFRVELPLRCANASYADHLERERDHGPSVSGRTVAGTIGAYELRTIVAWL